MGEDTRTHLRAIGAGRRSASSSRAEAAPKVAIVGGGASGTLVAAQLLRRHHRDGLRVVLIERRERVGQGAAYSTPWPYHRLNVPAGEMGALPRDPGHFVRWARRHDPGIVATDFAPRSLYGEYLGDLLRDSERAAFEGVGVECLRDEAIDLAVTEGPARPMVTIALRSGGVVRADLAVLALGNLPPGHPPGCDPEVLASDRYEADPWDPELPSRAAGEESVLLLGTGLTMVDVALTLGREGGPANIRAISRKGMMPRVHRPAMKPPERWFELPRDRWTLEDVVAQVESEIAAAEGAGGDWRQVIDSLRPLTNQIWLRFSEADRRRFVERLSRRWDVHRHRMAPDVGEMLRDLERRGRLAVGMASVESLRLRGGRVEVVLRTPQTPEPEVILVDRVINCTGPALDLRTVGEPLIDALFARRHVRRGPLRLGLDHDSRGALIDWRGTPSRQLFTLGPTRKGRLWETTAIPEIRMQAFELADQLTCALARTWIPAADELAVAS